jgi:single-strand DNA-binding protein
MRDMNTVTLIWSIGQEPELKAIPSGKLTVRVSLATNFRWKDRDGNLKENVEWHTLTLWDAAAEQFSATIHKGDRVFVKGSIHYGKFTNKLGAEIPTVEIKVEDFGKMTKPEKQGGEQPTGPRRPAKVDDDIPF